MSEKGLRSRLSKVDIREPIDEEDGQVPRHDRAPRPSEAVRMGGKNGWDVVAFYPIEEPDDEKEKEILARKTKLRENFFWRLRQIGFAVVPQKSTDNDTVMLKICAHDDVLAPHAERIGMEMKSRAVDPKTRRHYYREFEMDKRDEFVGAGPDRLFSSLERQRLIFSMMEESVAHGGAGLDLSTFEKDAGVTLAPMHDDEAQDALANKWLKSAVFSLKGMKQALFHQPLDDIRDYFGEKIALYFAWLDWYIKFLVPLSLVGLLVFLIQLGTGLDYSNIATVVYAIVLCLWATVFTEFWKRREATLAYNWDVQDFEEEERVRPSFLGVTKPGMYTQTGMWVDLGYKITDDGVDEKLVPHNPYFSSLRRLGRVAVSMSVLCVFLFVLIIGTFSILAFRIFVQADARAGALGGGIVAGILNAVFIIFMNVVYSKVAVVLNNRENHRTETSYEDKLIAKQFSFKFVNSYSALAFIAFIKREPLPSWLLNVAEEELPREFSTPNLVLGMDIGRCKGDSCMSELFTQLMTLQISMIFISNFTEVGIPYVKKRLSVFMENRRARKLAKDGVVRELPKFEQQINWPVFNGVLDEYTELMLQFGYVTLFASAFPLSSLCALISNFAEVRVDGFKLLFATRRPRYQGAEDIGTWQSVLEFMSILSVISNCAIICFTSQVFKGAPINRESADFTACITVCNSTVPDLAALRAAIDPTQWPTVNAFSNGLADTNQCILDCNCDPAQTVCYGLATRVWIFVVSEHILIGLKLIIAFLIPDKPSAIEQAEARAGVEHDLIHNEKLREFKVSDAELKRWAEETELITGWDNEGHAK